MLRIRLLRRLKDHARLVEHLWITAEDTELALCLCPLFIARRAAIQLRGERLYLLQHVFGLGGENRSLNRESQVGQSRRQESPHFSAAGRPLPTTRGERACSPKPCTRPASPRQKPLVPFYHEPHGGNGDGGADLVLASRRARERARPCCGGRPPSGAGAMAV